MKDTSDHIYNSQRAIIMSKTPGERFRMTIDMYETSRVFAASAIKAGNPGITDTDLKIEMLKRFYKNDFSEDDLNKIISRLKTISNE